MKKLAIVLLGITLVGCEDVPKNDNEYVRFLNNNGNVVSIPIYTRNRITDYNHYMCVDGDAVVVRRDRKDHHIIDVNSIGKNCAKYTIDVSKIEPVKFQAPPPPKFTFDSK